MSGLGSEIIGRKIIHLREVDSTNEYAKLIALDEREGTVVVADRQTAGKGRKGRTWASPEGGLWMSVILKPKAESKHLSKLVFIGALAVVDTLWKFGIEAGIKWPNDVWVNGRKICGVLTEGRIGEFVILGIGLNVNNDAPEELRKMATSMREFLGREVSLSEVFRALIRNLDHWYRLFLNGRYAEIISALKERSIVLGKEVKIIDDETELVGRAVDIDVDGALILETPKGRVRVLHGDVSLRFL
ncbi:biotin--[acetyl-CoA-carboxylase] ligase [Thermococcus sp. GR7]|uniref:biotin--[acetyl-CoA-carboxylase] ligase n=1 Tax=unclassified Thermococcus TaxID=2627626 RepID=UPI00143091EA|nr:MULTISPECIES: biotin--[acetyl-CoA-carboxylase] ligase [unclassified Thermococcus]NJE47547.1 biotin--[acetyl-CoA-carboxylase] ligase [Thermococcus sp. GR7]NJE79520.1 biotin--[acetyl-CoA-carboxylase] ligase [Thermococcus sp. GR4]NJF22497.1 biotin--[acetyl-CoA-carboxylase] ligase [Thermococcus sp. GR5]